MTVLCDICGKEMHRGTDSRTIDLQKGRRAEQKATAVVSIIGPKMERTTYRDVCDECSEGIIAYIKSRKVTSE